MGRRHRTFGSVVVSMGATNPIVTRSLILLAATDVIAWWCARGEGSGKSHPAGGSCYHALAQFRGS